MSNLKLAMNSNFNIPSIPESVFSTLEALNNSPMQKLISEMQESTISFNQSIATRYAPFNDAISLLNDEVIKLASIPSLTDKVHTYSPLRDHLSGVQKSVLLAFDESISAFAEAVALLQSDKFESISTVINSITEMKLSIPSMISTTLTEWFSHNNRLPLYFE